MQCPFCGAEMEEGTFRSRGCNFFLPKGKRAAFYTKRCMEKANAVMLPPSPYKMALSSLQWPRAYCCRSCRKIIIEYEEE